MSLKVASHGVKLATPSDQTILMGTSASSSRLGTDGGMKKAVIKELRHCWRAASGNFVSHRPAGAGSFKSVRLKF